MVCVNQTRPHCVNQMVKTQSKPLAERHGRGTAWERHGMCESAFNDMISWLSLLPFSFLRHYSKIIATKFLLLLLLKLFFQI
jgi:hypothetical protein